jgi:hypothetical protein
VLAAWAAVGAGVELALGRRQRGRPLFATLPGVVANGNRPDVAPPKARVATPVGVE